METMSSIGAGVGGTSGMSACAGMVNTSTLIAPLTLRIIFVSIRSVLISSSTSGVPID
jgi:hypothetical protein